MLPIPRNITIQSFGPFFKVNYIYQVLEIICGTFFSSLDFLAVLVICIDGWLSRTSLEGKPEVLGCWVWVVEYPLDLMTGGSPEFGDVTSRCRHRETAFLEH